MNSKTMISIFVVAMCLLIAVVHSQECTLITTPCGEGSCCVVPLGLSNLSGRGNCSNGEAGQGCMGIRICQCNEGLECKKHKCVASSSSEESDEVTTPAVTTTAEVTTPVVTTPAETTVSSTTTTTVAP